MDDRARLWRCIREAAGMYLPPDHLTEDHLRKTARALCSGVATWPEDQAALGPLPDFVDTDKEPKT